MLLALNVFGAALCVGLPLVLVEVVCVGVAALCELQQWIFKEGRDSCKKWRLSLRPFCGASCRTLPVVMTLG